MKGRLYRHKGMVLNCPKSRVCYF